MGFFSFIGDAWEDVKDFGSDLIDIGSDVFDFLIDVSLAPVEFLFDLFVPDIPDFDRSPTYSSDRIGNTISEGVPVSRCYGKCKIGGNKIRFNAATDPDIRMIVGHCRGSVNGITRTEINDIEFSELTGAHTKTEYTGTRTQIVDPRFTDEASAYRTIAYTAFTFVKNDKQVGYNPNVTVVMEGLLCLSFPVSLGLTWTGPAFGSFFKDISGFSFNHEGAKVSFGGVDATEANFASLGLGQWGIDGFDNIYVRLFDDTDPDTKADGFVQFEERVFSRNPSVILYDWYRDVEEYRHTQLNIDAFRSLEELCDDIPSGSSLPRYRFDFNIDTNMAKNDAKKLIWASFNGRSIMSQGKIKPIWDSAQIADGAGSLTAKTVSHAFDLDNIVKGSFTWQQIEHPNLVRTHFKDSEKNYKSSSVEIKDEIDIQENGLIIFEEKAWFLTDAELARRRARYKYNTRKYPDYSAQFTALSGASDLEALDLVTITHTLPGWTDKQFLVTSRSEDSLGLMQFKVVAYFPGAYDDAQVGEQDGFESVLPNPFQTPAPATSISAAMTAVGTAYDFDAVRVSFTPPTTDPFYSYSEIYASNDDSTYFFIGNSDGSGSFTFNALGVVYEPGDTVSIKLRSVSETGVFGDLPGAADTSLLVTSTMKLAGFYASTNDIYGGNSSIGNVATTVVLGNLDGVPKIALGATADSLTISNMATFPGFYADGLGNVRGGNAGGGFVATGGTFTVSGSLVAGSIHIPDIDTTANSFHTNTAGTSWWGSTQTDFNANNNNANAYILNTGEAKFQNITATGGLIGNWTIAATTLSSANITLDQANDKITVNTITIDGANDRIRSANYVSGVAGSGFTLEPDLLEVGNIRARGVIRTAVFQKNVISAVGGNLFIRPADVLAADMTSDDETGTIRITEDGDTRISEAGDTRISEGYGEITIDGDDVFEIGDILRTKDGIDDEWMEVSLIHNAPTYAIIRDKAGSYSANSNPEWKKGASVVSYGQDGDGGIFMTSSESNAPYMSIFTHTGTPWSSIDTRLRIGNLNGFLDYSTDLFGIAIGETLKHLKYDPENGLVLKGPGITSGTMTSSNFDASNGMQIDLDNAIITIRESDGLIIDSAGGLSVLSGAGISISDGGDIILTGDALDPGKVIFNSDTRSIELGMEDANDIFSILPDAKGKVVLNIGNTQSWGAVSDPNFKSIDLVSGPDGASYTDSHIRLTYNDTSANLIQNFLFIDENAISMESSFASVTFPYSNKFEVTKDKASFSFVDTLALVNTEIASFERTGIFTYKIDLNVPVNISALTSYFQNFATSTPTDSIFLENLSTTSFVSPSIGFKLNHPTHIDNQVKIAGNQSAEFSVYTTDDAWATSNIAATIGIITAQFNSVISTTNGVIEMLETTTPATHVNFGQIYTKSDNKLYFKDGGGTEHEIAFV